ncbi:hypothetical protein CAEBREN_32035 [Caenorhabditis brenneri]|uniref:CUB-like domain-containing protein n=1 Tax=Caenorhabditis brenneri TaxID=135651 RepID=G0MRU6_CAEBE|nr:hypothetical protein CAEBREN_32035 [Caenorhabditis brenneri]
MASNKYALFSVVFSFVIISLSASFECPTSHIKKEAGMTGVLPAGARSQVQIPQGTNCIYKFEIPRGFALKMMTTAKYKSGYGDYIKFDNFYITSLANKEIEYSVNEELSYQVVSATGELTFIATYTFIDLTTYQQVLKPTGTYFNTTLEEGNYYTVVASAENDQVHLTYGSLPNVFGDGTIYQVFLYDGPDIINSRYMGRITEAFDYQNSFYSSTNTLTLLNLYGKPSRSVFVGNDASGIFFEQLPLKIPLISAIKYLDHYDVLVMDSYSEFDDWMGLVQQPDFIPDAWHTHALGYAEIQGMTPSHRRPTLLDYPFSLSNSNSLPQLIPAPMATFHLHNASFETELTPGGQQKTFEAAPGKTRYICSPHLWDPNAVPSFDYTFSNPNSSQQDFLSPYFTSSPQIYNFSINLQTIELENEGDELEVQVGYLNGVTPLKKKYSKTKFSNQFISGFGEFLKLKYTGNNTSIVIINFEMIDLPPTTTQSTSTIRPTTRTWPPKTVSTRTSKVTTTTSPRTSSSFSTAPSAVTTTTKVPMTSESTVVTTSLPSTSTRITTSPPASNVITASTVNLTVQPTSTTSPPLTTTITTYSSTKHTTTPSSQTSNSTLISTPKSTPGNTTPPVTSPPTNTTPSSTPNLITVLSSSTATPIQKTTTYHVETTTKSVSSHFYTGLLVLVISSLIF